MSDFLIWTTTHEPGWCVVRAPKPLEKTYELIEGVSMADHWPADISCRMSNDYPKDLQLADSLHGTSVRVISDRLRSALERHGVVDIEFLPLSILNHKGRVSAREYWFVNPPRTIDCIDLDASNAQWDGDMVDADDAFVACDQLVLRQEVIPAGVLLFRPRYQARLLLMRRSLAATLQSEGYGGLVFREPSRYNGLF